MTHEKDDRPAAGGISIKNGMNDTTVIPLTSLNPKQWEMLLQILNNQSGSIVKMNGKYFWIIDSGALHHMTGIIEDLSNLKEIVQWPVKLPDGNIAMAKKEGDVCFDNGFVLRNVLYVHGLTCNFLSVPQLLDEGNCIIQFAPNICVIQDLTSRKVIGAGERRDGGLFYFREMPPTRAFKTTTTLPFDLWHKRLGHPSLEVLKLLPQEQIQEENLGRGHRKKETSVHLRDYVTNTVKKKSLSCSTPPAQSRSSGTPYPIAHYVNCDKFSSCHRTFLEAIEKEREPVTYYEAIKDKRWRSAMDSELKALEQNKTWTIDKLPPNKKALRCKWVYKIKYKSDGTIERFKARLVILGNHQVAGVDYSETFTPVVKMVNLGKRANFSDYSLFTLQQNGVQLNVLVYVDDLIVSGNDHEVVRAKEGIFLCQRKYALDIIFEVGLLGAKPTKIPMEQNHHLGLAQRRLFEDPEQYRRLVGRLIYLFFTRPDLAYSVHILSQFMQNPQIEHWEATIRVVRYLKGSPRQGIILKNKGDLQLRGWCDADWAGCPLTRRSLTRWLVYLGDSPISWKTKKQHNVSRSSAEAEYRFMALTTGELKCQAALHISRNLVFHERTKHIEVDCHYIRYELVSGNLDARHVHTKEQVADFFSKALGKAEFDYLLRKLGVQDLHLPT
ncbi:retrovirus-related pol polyprotein from transposon RE2 [Tanacetum coccineum]